MASQRHVSFKRVVLRNPSRSAKILALLPPKHAQSDSEDTDSEDDITKFDSYSSSPAPSIPSSLENLMLISDSEAEEGTVADLNSSLERHILGQSFPSVQSPASPRSLPPSQAPLLKHVLLTHTNLPSPSPISSAPATPNPTAPRVSPTPTSVGSPLVCSSPASLRNADPGTAAKTNNTRSKRCRVLASIKQPRILKRKAKELKYCWNKNKKFLHKVVTKCFEKAPLHSEPNSASSPLDYFSLFLSDNIIEYLVEQSNLYSVQCTGKSTNITVLEMKDFLSIKLLMGIIKLSAYTDFWDTDLRIGTVSNIMPLKRYQQIRRYLHFVDNLEDNGDRYYKVRPIVDMIRENCLKFEKGQTFSVDEMMIPYKGKKAGNRKQYMKNKPSKWGFKMFVRALISGFACDFLLYGGDDTFRGRRLTEEERSLGLGAMVVLALCKSIRDKPGCTVFFDNFFTSFELMNKLRSEYGILSLGTMRPNRLRGAEKFLIPDKQLKKKGRGSFCQAVCNKNKVSVTKWFDNKIVHVASSYSDAYPVNKIRRYCKEKKRRADVDCPNVISEYNKHMGGVDLADMLIALYRTEFRTQRWYMAIFSQLIDICVNNAWLLWRQDNPNQKKKLKKFRIEISNEILKRGRARNDVAVEEIKVAKIQKPQSARPTESIRYDNVDHWPIFTVRGRCKNCKNGQTNVKCTKCDQRLCMVEKRNCFYDFHHH